MSGLLKVNPDCLKEKTPKIRDYIKLSSLSDMGYLVLVLVHGPRVLVRGL